MPHQRVRRAPALAVLGLLSFTLVLAGGLLGGLGGALVALGLPLFGLGLGATIVGRARWALITSRQVGTLVLAAGLLTTALGAALPTPASPVATNLPLPTTAPPSPDPERSAPATGASVPAPVATTSEPSAPQTSTEPAGDQADEATAQALLGTLEVKGRAPKTGYDRDLFGQAWADADRNGCDTRNDVLRRDLSEVEVRPGTNGCVVLSGVLAEPYSGRSVPFTRGQGTSELVQIDHVVALSDAWQKGAQQWSPQRRVAFANDPLNLLAVDGGLNMQKGDGDAATWLPPDRSFRCAYVARQVAVKAKYGAWVSAAERDAIARVLAACPDQGAPSSDAPVEATIAAAPTPASGPQPPAAPPAGASCDPAYPGVCVPPHAEVGDLDCGDVPHRRFAVHAPDLHGFDADGDGEGCES